MVAVVLFVECLVCTIASIWVYFVYLQRRNAQASAVIASLEAQRKGRHQGENARGFNMEHVLEAGTLPANGSEVSESTWRRGAVVLRETAPQAVNVFSVFLVTMSVFPGVVLSWQPGSGSAFLAKVLLFRTLLLGAFQLFDVIGRSAAQGCSRCIAPRRIWVIVLLRFALVPLFMLGQRKPELSVLCGSDGGRLLLVAALAFTNGLAASLSMMAGPLLCPDARREVAGMAMSCVMVTGIFAGSLLALLTQLGVHAS
mmetsp:Transcript_170338/g.540997  ORF Transcript_170338/g.540997 Transcript_170338/m.540997 type:complete len:256 (-) Transcript_170338:158-925(-)